MAKVDELLDCQENKPSVRVGLRLNPVVGGGDMDILNTATKWAKFGLPLMEETKDQLIDLYKKYRWLKGVHFHVGSQGNPMDLFIDAAKIVMSFVKEVEEKCQRQIETIDIGGGLSSSYDSSKEPTGLDYQTYRNQLQQAVPELFSGRFKVITEMGRSLALKAGKTLTRVEAIKQWLPDVKPLVLTHVGSNQFIWEAYVKSCYKHRIQVVEPAAGTIKTQGPKVTYDIGGCLCFQGDYLRKDVELVEAQKGDILLIHDTGAYTMAMYSKFNSIQPSPTYGYRRNKNTAGANQAYEIVCLKERETLPETLAFWGNDNPRTIS